MIRSLVNIATALKFIIAAIALWLIWVIFIKPLVPDIQLIENYYFGPRR